MNLYGKIIGNKYKIINKIEEGSISTVWQAFDNNDRKVVVKVLKKNLTSNRVEDLIRFKGEAVNVSKLAIDGISKIYEIGEYESLYYIVMEYIEGENLQTLINKDHVFSIEEVLDIIYYLSKTLKEVHNINIIHRDIKPGNVIVRKVLEEDKEIYKTTLIDFGLSQIRNFDFENSKNLIGTILYMPPEQSGFIKSVMDDRADLYSLGIMFYQLLSNRLPFEGEDLNSIIYQHIAKNPMKLTKINHQIPVVLEKIVFKLIEKEPENRYQSVSGLIKDIEQFKKGNVNFEPGLNDNLLKLNYRTKLIGRKKEYNYLKIKMDEAVNGKGSICILSGGAGIGKSRLIEELRSYIYKEKIIFLEGKCFFGENIVPFDPFKEALNNYVKYFKKYSEKERLNIKDIIMEYVGDLGGVALEFNPILKEIISEYKTAAKLDLNDEKFRNNIVITNLIKAISKAHKALVILIDDMQWIDEGSLSLLSTISVEIKDFNILIIGTYRNEDNLKFNKINNFIEESEYKEYRVFEIKLNNFDLKEVKRLTSGILYEDINNVDKISNFVLKKSKGNPYFSIEILKQMANEKVIIRNNSYWEFNEELLYKIVVPNSVVDIVLTRVYKLNNREKTVLSYAAIVGMSFYVDFLFNIMNFNKNEIIEIIDMAIEMQFIERDFQIKGKCKFFHERVKNIFYEFIEKKQRLIIHAEIVEKIEKRFKSEDENVKNDFEKDIYSLVKHYIILDRKDKLLEYLIPAALMSKKLYAHKDAAYYYYKAIEIMEINGDTDSKLYFDTVLNLSELYILLGKNYEAIKISNNKLLTNVKNKEYLFNIYKTIAGAYAFIGDTDKTEKMVKKGVNIMGKSFPVIKKYVVLNLVKEMIVHLILDLVPIEFFWKEKKKSQKHKRIPEIYSTIVFLYAVTDLIKFINITITSLNLSKLCVGKSKEFIDSVLGFSGMFMLMGYFKKSISYFEKSYNMSKEIGYEDGIAMYYLYSSFCYMYKGDLEKSIKNSKNCINIYRNKGNFSNESLGYNSLISAYYFKSKYKEMKRELDNYIVLAEKRDDKYIFFGAKKYYASYYRETGDFKKSKEIIFDTLEKISDKNEYLNECMINIELGILYLEMGKVNMSKNAFKKAYEIDKNNKLLRFNIVLLYPYFLESYILELTECATEFSRKEVRRKIRKIKRLCVKALKVTKKWPVYMGITYRVIAKYYMIKKNLKRSEYYFKKSINWNWEQGRLFELAKSKYEYGIFLKLEFRKKDSLHNLEESYDIFKKLDAKFYIKKLKKELGIILKDEDSSNRISNEIRMHQRMSSIISLSHDISSILDLNILLDKVLNVAMEVTGANNGYLLLRDEHTGKMKVYVSKLTDITDTVSDAIINEVLEKGEAVITTNAVIEDKYSTYQSISINKLRSIVCFPIKYNDQVKGICFLDNNLSGSVFSYEDIAVLNSIMTQAAISIENAKLYRMAITDGLTGLIVNKHFKYLLDKELARCKRYNKIFSLFMFDIDNFKIINDNYGHQAGDYIISKVSELVTKSFRASDIVSRYGGEEFAVILTETDKEGAVICSERFRSKIEKEIFEYDNNRIAVTISGGIAAYPYDNDNDELIIKCADRALYNSKNKGKNMITLYEKSIETFENYKIET